MVVVLGVARFKRGVKEVVTTSDQFEELGSSLCAIGKGERGCTIHAMLERCEFIPI